MSYDLNVSKLSKFKGKTIFLFDSSTFCRYEELFLYSGINFFEVLGKLDRIIFLLTNEVIVELMNGPRKLHPKFLLDHIINVEGSMDHSLKENRFLYEKKGKLHYMVLNKVSAVDWNQVLLCQNHSDLVLVTNDRKLLKSSKVILGDRSFGAASLIYKLLEMYPDDTDLQSLEIKSKELFKHGRLGNIRY